MDDIFNDRRKRLREFINSLIIKDKQFAESIGKKPAVLSQLLNGYRKITADFAYEVAECYTWLNPDWLISGNGEMKRVVETTQFNEVRSRTQEEFEEDYKNDPLSGLKEVLADYETRLAALEDRIDAMEREAKVGYRKGS